MRKNILFMSVSLLITALFIGLAVMPVTSELTRDTRPVANDINEEESLSGESADAITGENALPEERQPPEQEPPCNQCALAVLSAIADTMPARTAAISEFVDLILNIPEYDDIVQFNDALASWFINHRLPVVNEMIEKLQDYNFNLGIAEAVDAGFNAIKKLGEQLYLAWKDGLEYPLLTTLITVSEMTFLFVIISGGVLILQCFSELFNGGETAQSAPASTENTMPASQPATQTTLSGTMSL